MEALLTNIRANLTRLENAVASQSALLDDMDKRLTSIDSLMLATTEALEKGQDDPASCACCRK